MHISPLAVLALEGIVLFAQTPAPRMEITLEKQEAGRWRAVDPGFVFEKGDRIRFRFRANFQGRLYVMNYGTSGAYTLLFPREETGQQNLIEVSKEYRVPATEAWFRVDGPPGYDIIYWLMSPVSLGAGVGDLAPPGPPRRPQPPKTLIPRCDDTLMRARGQCIDSSAGPRNVSGAGDLPDNLSSLPRASSRELIIMRKQESFSVSSPAPLTGPVIYEFRLAHK
jgi:hypothetical protein